MSFTEIDLILSLFNISFGRPRTDTCTVCDELETKITCAESSQKDSLLMQKSLHLRKAECFYSFLNSDVEVTTSLSCLVWVGNQR